MIDSIITEDSFNQELMKRIQNMEVKYAKPDEFKTDGDNPNVMTETQLKALETSIKRFGTIVPIVVDQNMTMVDGEQRLTIYRRVGVTRIPFVQLNLTDSERRILRQTLNKLKGSHDYELDLAEYSKIIDAGSTEDLKSLLGWTERDLNKILDDLKNEEPDEEKPKPSDVVTCPHCGQSFTIGIAVKQKTPKVEDEDDQSYTG